MKKIIPQIAVWAVYFIVCLPFILGDHPHNAVRFGFGIMTLAYPVAAFFSFGIGHDTLSKENSEKLLEVLIAIYVIGILVGLIIL